ncbi:MAG: hypothetical protein K9G70_09065 [Prolixibacteraceae bacterium]|nr:hypothetical protein [Prolixibacteraceae bacterium]
MKYLLDSNICIHFFRGKFGVIGKLNEVGLIKIGKMVSDFDLLIGCTAVEKGLVMVTENLKEFQRISNIRLENWIER